MIEKNKRNGVIWREIMKLKKRYGPSVARELHGCRTLDQTEREEAYAEAVRNASYASSGTKRKWRKALGLSLKEAA